ncbi:MAG: DUF4105 domain-containing protein, partial [Candidatus Binatia bacterium]
MGIRQTVAHGPLALLLCSGVLLLAGRPALAAAADPTYADTLIAAARAQRLAADPQWLALVHYQPRRLGGVRSAVDSAWFFQAPDGATDPQAELEATLRVFFAADAQMKDGEPPQCALRARYEWLARRLQFDPLRLPPQACVEFDQWRTGLGATGVTLIFPEAYMNNPSSMFGHTLLRLDTGPPGARQDLLAYGTNFSADTGSDGGIAFAFKGMLGFYPGRFTIQPYYEIVRVYGDWERRDIWEYQLALSQADVDLLVAHLWELRGVEFDYYFFDENCSYQLLALLEAARPDLHLKDQFGVWVIPADTVRVVVGEPGLVTSTSFRASAGTR